jgi:hypothetical protein
MQIVNNEIRGATLFEANIVLSNELPGVPNRNVALASSIPARRTGPPIDQDPRLKERVVGFVSEFVASAQSGSSLPPLRPLG